MDFLSSHLLWMRLWAVEHICCAHTKSAKKWWRDVQPHKGAFIINDFLKNPHFSRKHNIFATSYHRQTCQKYHCAILENKLILKSKLIPSLKMWSSSLIFFNEEKIEKDSIDLLKNYFENQNFAIFEEAVDNFGKSDTDMISEKIMISTWCVCVFMC